MMQDNCLDGEIVPMVINRKELFSVATKLYWIRKCVCLVMSFETLSNIGGGEDVPRSYRPIDTITVYAIEVFINDDVPLDTIEVMHIHTYQDQLKKKR